MIDKNDTAKLALIFLAALFGDGVQANGKVNVVATLPDLQYIVQEVGGDQVEVAVIAKGYQDPHYVDAKPSFVLKLKKADLFIQVGLDLEIGWVPPLLDTARNKKIYFGGPGYLNASEGVDLLEIPQTSAAELRAQGDIHIYGNPHYWLDPQNGKTIARNIFRKLTTAKPESEAYFESNLNRFCARIDSAMLVWDKKMAAYQGQKVIAYHNSWPYLEKRFGFEIIGFIEPKPGIPPTPAHLVSVIKRMRSADVKAVIISPYFDDRPAKSVASRTRATVVHLAPSVNAFKEVNSYFDLFDYNLSKLVEAFEK